jgi:hypothetical protein
MITPSMFSMGTILKMKFYLRILAIFEFPVKNSMMYWITKEAIV